MADPESVFAYYRSLIALRHADPVVRDGDFELLLPADPDLFVFTRTAEGVRLDWSRRMSATIQSSPRSTCGIG